MFDWRKLEKALNKGPKDEEGGPGNVAIHNVALDTIGNLMEEGRSLREIAVEANKQHEAEKTEAPLQPGAVRSIFFIVVKTLIAECLKKNGKKLEDLRLVKNQEPGWVMLDDGSLKFTEESSEAVRAIIAAEPDYHVVSKEDFKGSWNL